MSSDEREGGSSFTASSTPLPRPTEEGAGGPSAASAVGRCALWAAIRQRRPAGDGNRTRVPMRAPRHAWPGTAAPAAKEDDAEGADRAPPADRAEKPMAVDVVRSGRVFHVEIWQDQTVQAVTHLTHFPTTKRGIVSNRFPFEDI